MADYLEGWAVECYRCHSRRDLQPDERPLQAKSAPVAEMPRYICGGCGFPLLIRWRDVDIEVAELVV